MRVKDRPATGMKNKYMRSCKFEGRLATKTTNLRYELQVKGAQLHWVDEKGADDEMRVDEGWNSSSIGWMIHSFSWSVKTHAMDKQKTAR